MNRPSGRGFSGIRGLSMAAFALLLVAGSLHAACPLEVAHLRVGADPTYCTHNDIQSAINAVGSCPVIIDVTREHLYGGNNCDPNRPTGCHLSINAKNVTLQGYGDGVTCYVLTQCIPGPHCPAPATTDPLVTLDGGYTGERVLTITGGGNVNLRNLTITHGSTGYSEKGGGVYYSGAGNLNIARSTISFNYAGYGAGIAIEGSGANLRLLDYALVLSNSAQYSGGGIFVSGTSVLYAQQSPSLIAFNEALGDDPISHNSVGGFGGGVEINGPARADIGSAGYGGLGVIYSNTAKAGGGLAVFAGQDGDFTQPGRANLYTTDPDHPVTIQGNLASVHGGAVYSKGYVSYLYNVYNEASTCIGNGRIIDNAAPDGAIAYLDWDSDIVNEYTGSNLYINTATCGGSASVTCAPGKTCNQAYDNVSTDANANPTPGSAIMVGKSSTFRADKLDVRGSTGAHLIYIRGENYSNFAEDGLLRTCLLADNAVSDTLIVDYADTLQVDGCTIAGNVIGGSQVFQSGYSLTNSLVFQPDLPVGPFQQATYVLANNTSGLPAGATVKTVADPQFANAAQSDYHLLATSPAVDYAGGLAGTDLDFNPRDVDLAAHANTFGPRDLGAYELQSGPACDASADVIFCNGFQAQ